MHQRLPFGAGVPFVTSASPCYLPSSKSLIPFSDDIFYRDRENYDPDHTKKAYVPKFKLLRETAGHRSGAHRGFLGLGDSGRPEVQLTALASLILPELVASFGPREPSGVNQSNIHHRQELLHVRAVLSRRADSHRTRILKGVSWSPPLTLVTSA
jgi:hypothetical protein